MHGSADACRWHVKGRVTTRFLIRALDGSHRPEKHLLTLEKRRKKGDVSGNKCVSWTLHISLVFSKQDGKKSIKTLM